MTITVMRVDDVLQMPSIDSAGNAYHNVGDEVGYPDDPTDPNASVEATIARKWVNSRYYRELKEDIIEHGINKVPVHVNNGKEMSAVYSGNLPEQWDAVPVLGNGHHRMRILSDLGFPYILTTDTRNQSGYHNEYSSRQTNALFQPTRKEPTMTALNKGHFGFAVEVNLGEGEGWEITAGPLSRSAARAIKQNYLDRIKGHDFKHTPRVRVVPTGAPKEELVNG